VPRPEDLVCPCEDEHREVGAEKRRYVAREIERRGEFVSLTANTGVVFQVSRVYLAYHGVRMTELAALCHIYDWESAEVGSH
jgi:hypothetical protein